MSGSSIVRCSPARATENRSTEDEPRTRRGCSQACTSRQPARRAADRLRTATAGVTCGDESIPWFDPTDAGVRARILLLLEAPGRRATAKQGSGFVSADNDDPTAENAWHLYREAGIDRATDIVVWNVIPWYIGTDTGVRAWTHRDLHEAREVVRDLLEQLPDLRVVVLQGKAAAAAWERLDIDLPVIRSPHPSPQNLNTRPAMRESILTALRAAKAAAAEPLPSEVVRPEAPSTQAVPAGPQDGPAPARARNPQSRRLPKSWPRSTFVFLYGPPAVGKLTVAELLAERTGFRLAHNHLVIDAVTPLFPFGTEPFFDLVARFRSDRFEAAAREGLDLVLTYGYTPADEAAVRGCLEIVREHGGRLLFVQLVASRETLLERVVLPSRRDHGKLDDAASLEEVLTQWDFSQPVPFEPNLRIDTDTLNPTEAAERIISHYGLD